MSKFTLQDLEEILPEVISATVYSYEAGEYPIMSPRCEQFVAGDGGLLHSLHLLEAGLNDIAALSSRLEQLDARIRALHSPEDEYRKPQMPLVCAECVDDWPCTTIWILDGTE